MDEKIQSILSKYLDQIIVAEKEVQELRSRWEFCKQHSFLEEQRIASVKLEAKEMICYRWRAMFDELQDVLNKWNS